jgi:hypothetical protein
MSTFASTLAIRGLFVLGILIYITLSIVSHGTLPVNLHENKNSCTNFTPPGQIERYRDVGIAQIGVITFRVFLARQYVLAV